MRFLGEHIHAKIDFRENVSTIGDNACGVRGGDTSEGLNG